MPFKFICLAYTMTDMRIAHITAETPGHVQVVFLEVFATSFRNMLYICNVGPSEGRSKCYLGKMPVCNLNVSRQCECEWEAQDQ